MFVLLSNLNSNITEYRMMELEQMKKQYNKVAFEEKITKERLNQIESNSLQQSKITHNWLTCLI